MKRSFFKKKKHTFVIIKKPFILLLLLAITFLGIGYAQITDVNLYITGTVVAEAEKEVLITNIAFDSSNIADPNDSTIYDPYLTIMHSTIVLGNNTASTITYNVTIRNNTDADATYNKAIFTDELGYDNHDIEFVVSGIAKNDVLAPGAEVTFSITFKYIDSLANVYNDTLNSYIRFDFNTEEKIAKIGNTYYDTLQEAVDAVPADNSETTVILLKDTSELITIIKNKNIILNLQNNTLSNNGDNRVIYNFGTLTIYNGFITSDATQGAVNNENTGTITISGGSITATGTRQAFYNNKGIATITGTAYLSNTTGERAAVHNVSGGTLTISGGTILSNGHNGVTNDGTLILGNKDGIVSTSSPYIQGAKYGIGKDKNDGTIKFYDGIIKSKQNTFQNFNNLSETEDGFGLATDTETINGLTYNVTYLDVDYKLVQFNPNGGFVSERRRYVPVGHSVGTLPVPNRTGYDFLGWFTASNGGTQIDQTTPIDNQVTFYAHWKKKVNLVQVGANTYGSIQEAINNASNNTPTTLLLLENTTEAFIVASEKNIILDLNGNTITSPTDKPLIENNGILEITNGSLKSNAAQSIINNIAGSLTIDNANLSITSQKQALYITGGTVLITGNSYLSSTTSGTMNGSSMSRGTVHNVSGTLTILDATIIGLNNQAISNETGATTTIGSMNGSIDTTTPILRGSTYGIVSTGTLNFYDGKVMGVTGTINGTVTDIETNSQFVDNSEVIDNVNYQTRYLEAQ